MKIAMLITIIVAVNFGSNKYFIKFVIGLKSSARSFFPIITMIKVKGQKSTSKRIFFPSITKLFYQTRLEAKLDLTEMFNEVFAFSAEIWESECASEL